MPNFTYQEFLFQAMGCPCELKVYTPKNKNEEIIAEHLITTVRYYENKYTRFKPNSLTSHINNAAGTGKAIKVDEETAQLLQYADTLFHQSDGLFDITSGVLRTVWNFKHDVVPSKIDLNNLQKIIGWQKVEWKPPYILLPKKGMQIDFGGFVKEYIADVIATQAQKLGVKHGLVNLGGDIKIIGTHPDGSPWKVGIQHPRMPNEAIATVDLFTGGIASSGDYERFIIIDDIRYSHLLNPKTGKSIQPHYSGISVIAQDCLIAGSFSTLGLLMSESDKQWIKNAGLPFLTINQKMQISGSIQHD